MIFLGKHKKTFPQSKCLCYNCIMLKSVVRSMLSIFVVASLLIVFSSGYSKAATQTSDVDFEVNVVESLSVSITTPTAWATGDVDQFLRNKVSLSVTTSNSGGFTASMFSLSTTDLSNTSKTSVKIPTLAQSYQRGSFPANYWGYSLGISSFGGKTYGENDDGQASSYYYPMVSTSATPITLITANSGTYTGDRDIYFGAKANSSKAAGTYAGTVIFSVVTGIVDSHNPITPENPATPSDTTPGQASYDQTDNRTVYYTTTTDGDTTTGTTDITAGDTRSGYESPAGVVERANINGSSMAAGLAATAASAAAGGIFFIILAKRREDDEEEEEDSYNL